MSMRKTAVSILLAAILAIPTSSMADLPIGFEAKGGIGMGYYSMDQLNNHLMMIRNSLNANFSDLTNGFNVFIEGRVWTFGRIAGLAGYEHYWAEVLLNTPVGNVTYRSPSDVYYLGGVVNIFKFPLLVDINAGAKGMFAKAIYASNEEDEDRFEEYKANDYGWDIFAEVNTNFFKPLEVGLTVGYRNMSVGGFENKFGEEPVFTTTGNKVEIEYSGMYFYFTAGVALW
jgi:hypothetical protein